MTKRINQILFYCCLTAFIIGCQNKIDNRIIKEKLNNSQLNVLIDTVYINIDSTLLSSYKVFVVAPIKSLYYGYNNSTHSINVFSLKDLQFENNIPLNKEGPNGVEPLAAINIIDNKIYGITRNYIYILNQNGKLDSKVLINSLDDQFYSENQVFINNNTEFKFIKDEGIYVKTINYKNSISKDAKNHYNNGNILSLYSMKNNSFNGEFGIGYPTEYRDNYYGFNNFTYFLHSQNGNAIYYGFSALNDMFKYDKVSGETTQYTFKFDLPLNKGASLGWNNSAEPDRLIKHFVMNSNFGPLYQSKDLFFRTYASGLPEGWTDFTKAHEGKKQNLLVFDKQLNFLSFIDLNISDRNYNNGFVYNEKLFFPFSSENENILAFETYNISLK